MKSAVIVLGFIALSGCSTTTEAMCSSLQVGTPRGSRKGVTVASIQTSNFVSIRRPAMRSPEFDTGPVADQVCCFSKAHNEPTDACSAAQLECSDASLQGVELIHLDEPQPLTEIPDAVDGCFIFVKDNAILAVLLRRLS